MLGRFRTQLLWRGGEDLPECYESSATIAGEAKSNLVCHETAHDAPVNALAKIEAIRRAHGVRVNQRSSRFGKATLHEKQTVIFQTRSQLQN